MSLANCFETEGKSFLPAEKKKEAGVCAAVCMWDGAPLILRRPFSGCKRPEVNRFLLALFREKREQI